MKKIISIILYVVSIISVALLSFILIANNILPFKYRVGAIGIMAIIEIFLLFLLLKRHGKKKKDRNRIIVSVLAILIILMNSLFIYYISSGLSTIDKINNEQKTDELDFSIITLKDSAVRGIKDIEDSNALAGISQDKENIEKLKDYLSNQKGISLKMIDSKTYINAAEELINKKEDAMVFNEAYRPLIEDQIKDFKDKTKVVEHIKIKTSKSVKNNDLAKEVEKDKPFNVFISGIDTYGALSKVSRSDVNLILTVNPNKKKILITTIPRDSYVAIAGEGNEQMDKLTHAGIYGIDSSVSTVRNLLGIDLNYYARVNFSTFTEIVDVLDGIDVYNSQRFVSRHGKYLYEVGNLHLDGSRALSFARERYQLKEGDLDRGRNQEKVLKAIIQKAMSPSILVNYPNLLDIMARSTDTNIPKDKLMELINSQLDSQAQWSIETTEVKGQGKMGLPSYAMPGHNLYMYQLDKDSVKEVSEKIKEVLN
ncbi:MAG: LCP family protein [Finegoldia magna]|uniref:LCP family protein n=1 Tax=Finegoldia magna TaxID=1260 RepID=UPI000B916E3D|nr:LCP family protein [Finegoldia magna]MDU1010526.1 LCP family protein [Finegoldia magna]MDU1087768.1 LCP family protein [Finegoldia magna]MDU7890148.1 LCP family protein [Finegoldia magna]OXZ37478.1 hypothetical protein B9N50_08605 [Finegoldia magna]